MIGHSRESVLRTSIYRRGSVVIIAMIALLLASAISLALVKSSLAERSIVIQSQHRLQTQWLSEAGIERAVEQYRRDPKYNSEIWDVPKTLLGEGESCLIAIKIHAASLSTDSELVRVTVVTDFSTEKSQRIRGRKSVDIPAFELPD